MAKKIVRGITDVKTINNQDFDTNNVNDLLSDGQYNYIHRKKGKNEEYHNLTDNIKTISSDNTELLSVTNNNKTTNTATLHPKHDAQKEQVLESQNNTITINHGTNGTAEKTTVDTNPQKVLEHDNLIAGDYLTKVHTIEDNTTTLDLSNDFVNRVSLLELNQPKSLNTVNLLKGSGSEFIMGTGITNTTWNGDKKQSILTFSEPGVDLDINAEILPQYDKFFNFKPLKGYTYTQSIMIDTDATFNPHGEARWSWYTQDTHNYQKLHINKVGDKSYQIWTTLTWTLEDKILRPFDLESLHNVLEFRTSGTYLSFYKPKITIGNLPSDWSPSPEDVNTLLAQKQDVLTAGDGISITGDSIHLTSLNDYSEDLNNLTYTCTAKPIDNTPNLPTGVGGNGILSVSRVGNVVSQTYHALDNNIYYRITNNSSSTFTWTQWVKVTTTAV